MNPSEPHGGRLPIHDGIVLIDKKEGETSFDVVKRVRKILEVKKVGHAGTLDPFATGLLILLLGQGTKLSHFLMGTEKVYSGTLRLGIETDTQDPTGRVTETRPVPAMARTFIEEKARDFLGEIMQEPPLFSALKYKGKRSYTLARKGIPVKLGQRKVHIHSLKVTAVDLPDVAFEVRCSSGTYIRSLASDLGKHLGPGAHLKILKRLSSDPFHVKDALSSWDLLSDDAEGIMRNHVIPLSCALPHLQEWHIDCEAARDMRCGCIPKWEDMAFSFLPAGGEGYVKIVSGGELIAMVRVHRSLYDEGIQLKVMRIFH